MATSEETSDARRQRPHGVQIWLGRDCEEGGQDLGFRHTKEEPRFECARHAIWKFITRRMRAQEHKFSPSKRETRDAYIERLRRAAMSIPKKSIGKAIANMKSSCELLYRARGGHFEEGGH